MRLFKKLKIELPYDPEISFLGIYPKYIKAGSQRDIYTPITSLSHNSQEVETMSTNGCMDK